MHLRQKGAAASGARVGDVPAAPQPARLERHLCRADGAAAQAAARQLLHTGSL